MRLGPPIHVSALGSSPAAIVCIASASVGDDVGDPQHADVLGRHEARPARRARRGDEGDRGRLGDRDPGAGDADRGAGQTRRPTPGRRARGSRRPRATSASVRPGIGTSALHATSAPGRATRRVRRPRHGRRRRSSGRDTVHVLARSAATSVSTSSIARSGAPAQRSRNGLAGRDAAARASHVHARSPGTRPRDTRPSAVVSR